MSFKVIGIGEVLWDLLPGGPQLGGAPANFAHHARALGARAGVVSRIGDDPAGHSILRQFSASGIASRTVQIDRVAPTGTVHVTLSSDGVPNFVIAENVAWDHLSPEPVALNEMRNTDAVCFGSLAQRNPASRAAIQHLVAATPAESLRVFDVNLRQNYYSREVLEQSLRLATVLKLNDTELSLLAGLFDLGNSVEEQVRALEQRFNLQVVAVTRGALGSLLYRGGGWSESRPQNVKVIDSVGAGDAFTAALTLGLLHGLALDDINEFANTVAAFVCSCPGATPVLPDSVRARFEPATLRTRVQTSAPAA